MLSLDEVAAIERARPQVEAGRRFGAEEPPAEQHLADDRPRR